MSIYYDFSLKRCIFSMFVQMLIYIAHIFYIMPKKRIDIPVDDIKYHLKGLKTLIKEQYTQEAMAEYYRQKGIEVDRSTISRKLKEAKNMVTLIEDPERVHDDHYKIIGKRFEPNYVVRQTWGIDNYLISIFNGTGKGYTNIGTVTISADNKEVTIRGDPKLFLDIANEVEKLGYTVNIVY